MVAVGALTPAIARAVPDAALRHNGRDEAAELTGEDGPFAGQELSRRDLALLTRTLAVNPPRWPEAAHARYREERRRLGRDRHFQAKEEVARQFGHGVLDADLMREALGFGAALVGVGTVLKDTAQVCDVPLPPSMLGDSVHRATHVTLAWFSRMESSRARYRLAALEKVERADLRQLRPVPQENFLLRKKRISDLHSFQSILPRNP